MKNKVFRVVGYILLSIIIFVASIFLPILGLNGLNLLGNQTSLPKNFFDNNLNLSYVLVSVVLIGIFGFFYYLFTRKEEVSRVVLTLRQKIAVVVLGAFGISGISLLWLMFIDKVLMRLPVFQGMSENYIQYSDSIDSGPFLWVFLSICVVGPILEEIMFRGLLFKSLERAFRSPRPRSSFLACCLGCGTGRWSRVCIPR